MAGGDVAERLEVGEGVFDEVAGLVGSRVAGCGVFPVGLRGMGAAERFGSTARR